MRNMPSKCIFQRKLGLPIVVYMYDATLVKFSQNAGAMSTQLYMCRVLSKCRFRTRLGEHVFVYVYGAIQMQVSCKAGGI